MTGLLRLNRPWLLGLLILSVWPVFGKSRTAHNADHILGHWLFPSKGSSVEVFRTGDHYFARVAETDSAGEENFGLVKDKMLISNLTFDGQGWSGGKLIHPRTGMALDVELRLDDSQTITVFVFKSIKLLGKKFTMTRK